jgi:hypothetical protein
MSEETKTPPAPTPETKAYSELHNKYKSDQEAWKAEKTELEKKIQTLSDSNKQPEQLAKEIENLRNVNKEHETRLSRYESETKGLIDAGLKTLTPEQKALVDFSDPDPFKRLSFINTLKGQKPPVKTSQGAAVQDDPPLEIPVKDILEGESKGNATAYKKAVKDFGKEKVRAAIQKAKNEQAVRIERSTVQS